MASGGRDRPLGEWGAVRWSLIPRRPAEPRRWPGRQPQLLPSSDSPGTFPRPRVVRDARETPAQLDRGGELPTLIECGLDGRCVLLGDDEHAREHGDANGDPQAGDHVAADWRSAKCNYAQLSAISVSISRRCTYLRIISGVEWQDRRCGTTTRALLAAGSTQAEERRPQHLRGLRTNEVQRVRIIDVGRRD